MTEPSRPPHDSFSPGAFRPSGFRRDDWTPPLAVRTAVWLIKDIGVPVSLLVLIALVALGRVDSPLMRLLDIDTRTIAIMASLDSHDAVSSRFQLTLLDTLRKQRCMTAIAGIVTSSDVLARAALADNPCSVLETMQAPNTRR